MIKMLVGGRPGYLKDIVRCFAARPILKTAPALIGLLAINSCLAAEIVPDACGLVSRAEIQSALGSSPAGMDHAVTFRGGSTSLCQGRIGQVTLTVRVSVRSEQDSDNEATIAQMIITGGGKVETVITGAAKCTTIVPAATMAGEYGYDSMCAISLGNREVAVQAETHRLDDLIPVAKLRSLVMLAAKRLTGRR
jgi:hypothetical protein